MTFREKANELCNKKRSERQKLSPERVQELITDLEDYETKWSQWESTFIAQMQEKVKSEETLSDGQCDKLQEIHARYCSSGSSSRVKDKVRYNI